MDCGLDKDLIQESLDGSLGYVENMILMEHLKVCKSCKREYDNMAALFHEFESLEGDDIPEGLPLLRNQMLNVLNLDAEGSFGIKEFIMAQKAAYKGAGIFTEFVPGVTSGAKYVKKGIKKTPHVLYKTLNFAFKRGMKLMAARSKT